MDPSRRVPKSVIAMSVWLLLGWAAAPATAQVFEASLRELDYSPDPLARSPRLLGMGRLTLADDLHNRITLWEFAGNPTGIAEAESVTTVEFRPLFRSGTALRDLLGGLAGRERQELSARLMRQAFEAWHRAPGQAAYGLVGEVATLQVDRPLDAAVQRRGQFVVPGILGTVNGRVPWIPSDRFDFAVRVGHTVELHDEGYFQFFRLPQQGEYLGKESAAAPAPDLFTPNQLETSVLTGGLAFSMRAGLGIQAAVGYDRTRLKLRWDNQGLRSTSRLDEDRPFDVGQVSLIGRHGRRLAWGADGRAWRSRSQELFFWSVSAGPTQAPLSGSGKRLGREEEGNALRARARWLVGGLELGAALHTAYRRVVVIPWYPVTAGDRPGFNDFLDLVGARLGADTLRLPERVQASRVEERALGGVGGVSWRAPGGRVVAGAEVHAWRRRIEQPGVGSGPYARGWDARAGAEMRCNASLRARAGGGFGIADRDQRTADNAYRRATATAGFGLQPVGSRWSLDLGYAREWVNPDYLDLARSREIHQHLAVQMRWVL